MHSSQDILLGWLTHRILLIIGQDDHVLSRVAKVAIEIGRHVLDIIDTSPQLTSLSKVVDTDKQRLSTPCAIRVRKAVPLRSTRAEMVHALRRRRRSVRIPLIVCIRVHSWKTYVHISTGY